MNRKTAIGLVLLIATAAFTTLAPFSAAQEPRHGSEAGPDDADDTNAVTAEAPPCAWPEPAEPLPAAGTDRASPGSSSGGPDLHEDPIGPDHWTITRPPDDASAIVTRAPDGEEQRYWYDSFNGRVRLQTADGDTSGQSIEVVFLRLVEYQDSNGNGRRDTGESERAVYTVSELTHYARSAENPCGLTLAWTYGLGGTPEDAEVPRLIIRFAHTTHPTGYVGGAAIAPERVKIDIVVSGYEPAGGDSRLQMVHQVMSGGQMAMHPPSDGRDPHIASKESSGPPPLGYAWAKEGSVDGATVPVGATGYMDSPAYGDTAHTDTWTVVFDYPAGTDIVHDPELGRLTPQSLGVDIARAFPAGTLAGLAAGVLVGVVAVVGLSRPRRV